MVRLQRISPFLVLLLLASAAFAQQWTYSLNGNLYNTSGNVGVGNPAPAQRLSVGGNVEIADVAANAPELAQNGVDWAGSNIATGWGTSYWSSNGTGSVTFTPSILSDQNGFTGRYQRVEYTTVVGPVIGKLYQALTFQQYHTYRISFRYRASTQVQVILGDNEGGMTVPGNTGNAATVSIITSAVLFSRPSLDFYLQGGGNNPPQGGWLEVDDVSVKEATAGNALVRGMVGIGTGAPADPLHIEAASNANIRLVHSDPASAVNSIYFYEGSALYGFINQRGSAHATQPKQFNIGNNDANGAFSLWAGSNERVRLQSNGNIGVGAGVGGATSAFANTGSNVLDSIGIGINPGAITWRTNAQGYAAAVRNDINSGSWGNGMLVSTAIADSNTYALSVDSGSGGGLANRFAVRADGQVIIGGQPPGALSTDKLVVNGTIRGANVVATYQDVAEWVPATEEMAPGTVVVVERGAQNTVTPCAHPYDTRVAGVVSAQPGLTLGVPGASKAMIATTGRVKVRVDASHGAIEAGDLLVTGDRPGVAMRSEPVDVAGMKMHRPGTLIGKALEPLAGGEGEILVLLSLQ